MGFLSKVESLKYSLTGPIPDDRDEVVYPTDRESSASHIIQSGKLKHVGVDGLSGVWFLSFWEWEPWQE